MTVFATDCIRIAAQKRTSMTTAASRRCFAKAWYKSSGGGGQKFRLQQHGGFSDNAKSGMCALRLRPRPRA